METINDRLKILVEELGIKVLNDLDRMLGVSRNTTAHYTGLKRVKPGPEFLEKLFLKFPEIDVRWVMTGQGSMFLPEKLKLDYVEQLEKRYEQRDSEAKIFEMAMNMGMKVMSPAANFQSVSERTPGVKKVKFYEKYLEKVA